MAIPQALVAPRVEFAINRLCACPLSHHELTDRVINSNTTEFKRPVRRAFENRAFLRQPKSWGAENLGQL
jgi:hypothetical protein